MDDSKKCPNCGLMAGERDIDHSKINILWYNCVECGYGWQEVIDITDYREER